MTYLIKYNIYFTNNKSLTNKIIKVKNKDNDIFAKCALEDYLRRKYPNIDYIVIDSCEHFREPNLFGNLEDFFGIFK